MIKEKFKKLISYYKPYKKILLWDLLCSFISSLIVLTIPMIVRYIMNNVFKLETSHAIIAMIILAAVVFALFIINYACNRYIRYFGKNMGAEIEKDMRNELFDYYQKQSFNFFDGNKVGKLTAIMTIDIRNVSEFLHLAPEIFLDFVIRTIGAVIVFFVINVWLGCISTIILGLTLLYACNFIPRIQKIMENSHEKIADLNAQTEEILSGIKVVQNFTNEKFESQKFLKLNNEYLNSQKNIHKIESILNSGLNSFIMGLIPIITIISAFFVITGDIELNDVVTYILYVDILISPIFSVISISQNYQESVVGFKRFCDILRIKPEITSSLDALDIKTINGDIEFKNVYFSYGENTQNIFNNLNIKIYSGEHLTLVGSSGSGKTTFCNLIPRFYDVSNGEVLIDGINIKNIKLETLRKSIGFVSQDTILFSGSILDNIKYGNPDATFGEVIEAAKNSYIHDFVMSLPEKYNTQIGQRGTKLSSGQRQRIALARVILKNPPILIFDEVTSNLDSESEEYIQKSIKELSNGRTTIIITHKLFTIENAEKILLFDNGKIIEEGSHKELINKNGKYSNLYKFL